MRVSRVVQVALLAGSCLQTAQAQQKKVYIGNDDHTDYVWNCSEATNRQAFVDMLDYYLDLKDATASNPADYQSRFNCDAALMLRVYEESRTPAQFARLIEALRSGHISAPMTTLVNTYGGTPAEAVIRGMYYSGTLERRYNLRFRLAMAMENQTMPWGLSSLWAGSGAKYSWRGVCGCVTRTPYGGQREHEMYWYTGPDGQRVLMKWYSVGSGGSADSTIGGYAEARFLVPSVQYVTDSAAFNGFAARYPFDTIGVFGHGWDNNSSITDEFVLQAPLLSNASRRVIVSNELDFFQDFEAAYGQQIGTVNYSFGNEWELYQVSMVELTARVRRAVEKLRAAEGMASILTLSDPSFMHGRETDRLAFNLALGMYWEHDWTGDGGFGGEKQVLQRRLAADIERYVNTLHADAVTALGGRISRTATGHADGTQFFVFNPLGWTRTDAADLPWPAGGPVSVYDLANGGAEVPSQLVTINGVQHLRVWAENVPSVGYLVYEARPVTGQAFSSSASVAQAPATPGTATITYTVAADNRDAHSLNSGGAVHEVRVSGYGAADRNDYWGTDGEQQTAAVEFAVGLPAGTVITDARLVLQTSPSSNPSPSGSMRIRMYDVDDAQPFSNGLLGDLVGHHALAGAEVLWSSPGWPNSGTATSPNIAPLVQAFIARPGYTPGNHLGLVIDEGTMEANRYYGFADFASGGQPARLMVTYQSGSGSPSNDLIVENAESRVRVTPRGAISSFVDRTRSDREWGASINARSLNDLGGGSSADATGTLVVESAGPVSTTLRATCPGPVAHTSRITVYRAGGRVDLHNQITQNFTSNEEWGFSFNITNPVTRHEEVGAIMTARPRTLGGHYAAQNARYDWSTLNHFADMSDDAAGAGMTLSSIDVPFFRLGNSSVGTLDTATPQISPTAGGRLDGPGLGLANQGGDTLFTQRFALRPHDAYAAADSMRLAMEHANPPVAGLVSGSGSALPAGEFSLVEVSPGSVLLWAVKPAEDGPTAPGGPLTMRLWNLADVPAAGTVRLEFPRRRLSAGASCTHLETIDSEIVPAPVVAAGVLSAAMGPQQMRSFRVSVGCAADINADGAVSVQDIFDFLSLYFVGNLAADFNDSGALSVQDIFDFLSAYFAGC